MKLRCNATWIAADSGSRYEAGNVYDVADVKAREVDLAAPEGTFDVQGGEPPRRPPVAIEEPAVGTSTTASGMNVPDRRMRGGEVRAPAPAPAPAREATANDHCPWKRCDYVNKAVNKERALDAHLKRQHGGRRPRA